MRRLMKLSTIGLCCAVLSASVGAYGKEKKPAARPTDLGIVVEGNNRFALDLYAKLRAEKGNVFVSPYSISTALAMTCAGAAGDTETQMAKVLHFTLSRDRLHRAMGLLVSDLNKAGEKGDFQLVVANALWAQKDYVFLKEYLELVQTSYTAGLNHVDFKKDHEKARKTINAWVEDKTNDKIKDLIQPNILTVLTRLVLTNAIYFKGTWVSQFKEHNTQDKPFTLLDGKKIDVPTMHQTESFKYMENERLQALELDYHGRRVSMVILLPKQPNGLPALEKAINAKTLKSWLSKLRRQRALVAVPKFKLSYDLELSGTLVAMGMPDAFDVDQKADFSKMTGNKDLIISKVIHKAFIDLNEEGTEAAAATAVIMSVRGAMMPEQEKRFVADHPFLFLIRDVRTGSILFMGRMMNPEASE